MTDALVLAASAAPRRLRRVRLRGHLLRAGRRLQGGLRRRHALRHRLLRGGHVGRGSSAACRGACRGGGCCCPDRAAARGSRARAGTPDDDAPTLPPRTDARSYYPSRTCRTSRTLCGLKGACVPACAHLVHPRSQPPLHYLASGALCVAIHGALHGQLLTSPHPPALPPPPSPLPPPQIRGCSRTPPARPAADPTAPLASRAAPPTCRSRPAGPSTRTTRSASAPSRTTSRRATAAGGRTRPRRCAARRARRSRRAARGPSSSSRRPPRPPPLADWMDWWRPRLLACRSSG
jgi:hypothetical protein